MEDHAILIISLIVMYYHIGGLSTTNILRLTKGNSLTIHSTKCICDVCGKSIPPHLQLPIISFIVCSGRSKCCGTKLPIYPLLMEISVTVGMSFISIMFDLSPIGIVISFVFYEIVRIITVCIKGKRESNFIKQYIIAVFSMIPFFLSTLFVSLLYQIV